MGIGEAIFLGVITLLVVSFGAAFVECSMEQRKRERENRERRELQLRGTKQD